MPQSVGIKVGVTKVELEPWYSYDALIKALYRHKNQPYGLKRLNRSSPGRQMLVDFDSLPAYIQDALGDPRKCDHILEKYYRVDSEAVVFYNTYKFEDGTYLSETHKEKYIVNASVINAVLYLRTARTNEREAKGGKVNATKGVPSINETLCDDAASFNKTLRIKHGVTHTLPGEKKGFVNCLSAFEINGYISVINGRHKNDNARKVFEHTRELLESMFAGHREKPAPTQVSKQYDNFLAGNLEVINNATGEVYKPGDYKKITKSTVTRYLSKWESKIGTHARRSGDRQKYMGQYKPYHSFTKQAFAGSILSIDDRQPPFKATNGKRIWFYNAVDLGSYAFTCWVYGSTKEGIILEFYRQLLRNYHQYGFNLPAELEAEMSLNSSYVDTFLRPGVMFQHVHIEANNARAKRIERVYGSLRNEYEKGMKGFIPRPFAKKESNQPGPGEVPTIPHDEIVQNCLSAIEDWNNQPHPVEKHLSRWEFFCQKQNPNLLPTNYIGILPHIGYKTKSRCKVGIIKLDNGEYLLGDNGQVSLGEKLISYMKWVEGENLSIWWLDDNQGKVFKALIFLGDQYICEAIAKPTYNRAKIEQTPTDEANRAIMSAYVATIEAYGKRHRKSIEQVTIIDISPKKEKTFIMPGLDHWDGGNKECGGILPDIQDDEDKEEQKYDTSTKGRFYNLSNRW
jgi:hypothetical protein